MHLIVQQESRDLNKLELGEVFLFREQQKSISLLLKEDNLPRIVVTLKKEKQYFFFNEKDKAQELYDKAFVIAEDVYKDPKKFSDFIKTCEIDVNYKYASNKAIKIELDSDGTYSWTHTNGYQYSFPLERIEYHRNKTHKNERNNQ